MTDDQIGIMVTDIPRVCGGQVFTCPDLFLTVVSQFYFLLCWHTIGWTTEGIVDVRMIFSDTVIRTRVGPGLHERSPISGVPHEGDDSDQRQRRTFMAVLMPACAMLECYLLS